VFSPEPARRGAAAPRRRDRRNAAENTHLSKTRSSSLPEGNCAYAGWEQASSITLVLNIQREVSVPFLKGQSGNPGGRPKASLPDGRTLSEVAREHTSEAVATLAAVMRDLGSPQSARIAAASTLLDRGWGRASQDVVVSAVPSLPVESADEARANIARYIESERRRQSEAQLGGDITSHVSRVSSSNAGERNV
jgi:hypothetical protein